MLAQRASGVCSCGQFTTVVGATKEDARLLLNHEHGWANECAFEGHINYSDEELNLENPQGGGGGKRKRNTRNDTWKH